MVWNKNGCGATFVLYRIKKLVYAAGMDATIRSIMKSNTSFQALLSFSEKLRGRMVVNEWWSQFAVSAQKIFRDTGRLGLV
jgi:hypothetical protein